jgi:hypothetical protein
MANVDHVLLPTFIQVPFHTLIHRMDNGSRGLLQFSSLLAERKDLLEKDIFYALKVGKSNVFDFEIEASTSERLLGFYKNYYLYLYRATMTHHKDYTDNVLHSLDLLKTQRGARILNIKQQIQNDLRNITTAKEGLEKAKKVLLKANQDHVRATDKLSGLEKAVLDAQRGQEEKQKEGLVGKDKFLMGRVFSAFESHPEQDRDKQVRKVEKRRHELLAAKQGILERKKDLLEAYAALDEDYNKVCMTY